MACADFGRAVESEINSVEGKNKKEVTVKTNRVLRKMLGLPAQFRDPAASPQIPKKGED